MKNMTHDELAEKAKAYLRSYFPRLKKWYIDAFDYGIAMRELKCYSYQDVIEYFEHENN